MNLNERKQAQGNAAFIHTYSTFLAITDLDFKHLTSLTLQISVCVLLGYYSVQTNKMTPFVKVWK